MKKIIYYNIIATIIVLIITEIICFICAVKYQWKFIGKESIKYVYLCYTLPENYGYYDVPSKTERPISGVGAGKNYKKKPILLFGCSVTYGNKLSDEENFSGILSRVTKRPVYNLAQDGWTISHMYRQLQKNNEIRNIDPEYIIYTFIPDQKRRLYFFQGWPHNTGLYLKYHYDKNKKLQANKRHYPFYYRFLTVKYIQYSIERLQNKNKKATSHLMMDLFTSSVNIIKDRYPNAKLIFLLYYDQCNENFSNRIHSIKYFLTEEEYKKLIELGFEIINIEEIAKKSYCKAEYKIDILHPSTKMWEEFVPILVNKYNM